MNIDLHDYYISNISIDFDNKEATLLCNFEDNHTKANITISGFLAAKLEDIVTGSLILDFEEMDISSFIKLEGDYLISRKNWGWPISSGSLEEIQKSLIADEYKVWCLSATYGMCGYIIAKSIEIMKSE